MSEVLTTTRVEDAVAATSAFLRAERGTGIDGDFAGQQIAERVATVQERASSLLKSMPMRAQPGLFMPLSAQNAYQYAEAVSVLPGYMVLVPSSLVEAGPSKLYPAVVSEDGIKHKSLRLHVLKRPYQGQIRYGASMVLSAAGQMETKGVGDHGRKANDGVEAEHFATLLAAGSDQAVQTAWQAGQHINHGWRQGVNTSVTSQVSNRLFGSDIPQQTITITESQIIANQAALFWHEGMRDLQTGQPETAARDKALVVVQSLGFEALRSTNPSGIDAVKRLIG